MTFRAICVSITQQNCLKLNGADSEITHTYMLICSRNIKKNWKLLECIGIIKMIKVMMDIISYIFFYPRKL